MSASTGILAIWNDCEPCREVEYEAWYQEEHLPERLALTGFRVGRRFEAIDADRTYLTTYEVDSPEVLASAEYTARVNRPTERTTSIMRFGFTNVSRTVCGRELLGSHARGAVALTIALTGTHHDLGGLLAEYPLCPDMPHAELWTAVEVGEPNSTAAENSLRGKDDVITRCLTLEFLRDRDALAVAHELRPLLPQATVGAYRFLCCLTSQDNR